MEVTQRSASKTKLEHRKTCQYLVLKSLHNGFVHIKFDCDLRFASTHVTVGIGRIQRTRYEKLFPGVRLLVQKDLKRNSN